MRQGAPPRAFVELKAPTKPADPTRWRDHDKRQFEQFKELSCWGICNFSAFHLFRRDDELGNAIVVPERSLRADQTDARADRAIAEHDPEQFLRLVELLSAGAGQEPSARDAEHLASLMAYSARLVRGIVQDRLAELHEGGNERHALLQVRQEFRDVLYAHPEAAGYTATDFDALFSAAFAQTLAFGLLLVREGTGQPVGPDAWHHMPPEHPLMQTTLRVLSLDEVVHDIGIGFEVMCDTVNSFAPEILVPEPGGRDPILYFYENFLQTFDPVARERYGVYYTPVEVVRYNNVGLYAMPSGTGAGPAVWCHGIIPDYHAFRGSYGGYAFPLYDRRPDIDAPNISPALIESLSTAYGEPVPAEDVFAAILCLLSATSYTLRFAEDLEDVFPHVPFPAQLAVLQSAARVGREIRAVETFARHPGEAYRRPDFARVATQPRGALAKVEYADGEITLCDDGTGRIVGIPQAIWEFSVSGYRLVPHWLEARIGLPADLALVRELRDICGRIAELIDLFAQADIVLEATLHETLTREALGLGPGGQDADDGRD